MRKDSILFTLLFLFTLFSRFGVSQDSNDPRWNIDPRTVVNLSGDFVKLPTVETDIRQFTTEPQTTITPMGVMVTYPNVRVNPSNNFSQSELAISSSPINRNILFGSSNAYTFSTGTINAGVYVSLNGGLTWTGAETMGPGSANNQRADPGPVISKFGTFLFTHITSNTNFGAPTGMGANRSVNNGATWSNTFQVVNDIDADKNLTGTDDYPTSPFYGRSYFAWTSFSTSPANGRTSRTLDDGVTWSAPLTINTTPAGHNAQGHDVATGPGGEVYIVWASGVNFSPFTEDFMGIAKSVNGGLSYTATENAFNVNGSRSGSFNGWGIRTNGFPRIAVDKTGGARNGWIYVVSSEINNAPAGTDADVVFHRSINGGATWSAGIRVNQDALNNGKVQFFPAICVDEAGGLNVVYYDNRQFPSVGDSCGVYISRSLDGGNTWADVKISDHNFRPKQMSPFGGGYMGDYIGIAPTVGKVVAFWMDDKANTAGIPNAWAGALDITSGNSCQDFSGVTFPPSDFTLEFSGTQYWTRVTPSAYAAGAGSAKFDFWTAPVGTTQSLVTQTFSPAVANSYITFDRAYSAWFTNTDSLIIETSLNSGQTYTALARLWGNASTGAPLNTTAPNVANFVPTSGGQWRPTIFVLPVGTNRIKFRARSGFGNNLFLDNICVQVLPTAVANSIGVVPEGMLLPSFPYTRLNDTVRVYKHRTDFPNVVVDSAISIIGNDGVAANLLFSKALNGTYYTVVRHRNTIETWSNVGLAYTRGGNNHFNFIQPAGQAFANNQKLVYPAVQSGLHAMYSGDVGRTNLCGVQDSVIDGSDLICIENDAFNFLSGYVITDLTGDNFVDGADLAIADNNAFDLVIRIAPAGGEPDVVPVPTKFETEASRLKHEEGLRMQKEIDAKNPSLQNTKLSYKEYLKIKGNPDWKEVPRENSKNNIQKENNVDVRTNGKRAGDL